MPIIPYDKSQSTSRFSPIKNWSKILFRPDRKLQTTEIIEIQDFLDNQVARMFNTLYDFYTITKGCKVIVNAITSTGYACILTAGQAYVELDNLGRFVDLPSHNFTAPRTDIVSIGVVFNVELAQDLSEYNNPHSGGSAFGSPGADRIIIKPTIVTSTRSTPYEDGFYPIAIIKPKSPTFVTTFTDLGDGRPDIIYYRNEELTSVFRQRTLSTHIKKLMEIRFHELAGNFIDTGMDLLFDSKENILSITPGVAYVSGQRIQTNYNYSFKFDGFSDLNADGNLPLNFNYLVYLTKKGNFEIIQEPISNPFIPEIPPDSISIGTLRFIERDNNTLKTVFEILPARNRMPSVLELIELEKAHEENKKQLAQLALDIDLYQLSQGNGTLNGIIVDSFVNLTGSDIFDPQFNASILPAIQGISLPFISFSKDNRTFSIQEDSGIVFDTKVNEDNQQVLYWSTVAGNEERLVTQDIVTNLLNIPTYSPNSLMATASPNIVYKSDAATLVNYTHPDIKFFTGLDEAVVIDTPFNNNVYERGITVEASGFAANQDNIQLAINNVDIQAATILEGTAGSTSASLKASSAGDLKFVLDIPEIEEVEDYVISLTVGGQEATAEIQIIDPELSRTSREINPNFIIASPPKYSAVQSGILQTFLLDQPILLKGVDLYIADKPAVTNETLLSVYLVKINANGLPTDEALAYGTLLNSFALGGEELVNVPIEDRPISPPTTVLFDKPVNIKQRGEYGLIVNTSLEGVTLFMGRSGQPSLRNGAIVSKGNLFQGSLYSNEAGTWDPLWDADLSFRLVSHKPSSITSSTIISVENLEGQEFDIIDINLPIDLDVNSFLAIYVKDSQDQFQLVENGSYFFDTPVLSTDVRIDMSGTIQTHPVLELDNIQMNLIQTGQNCVWTSTNKSFESPYSQLNFSVDIFKPDSATYRFYYSSNRGVTWEELNAADSDTTLTIEQVNASLPVNKYTFIKKDLGFTTVNNEVSFRYDLKLKIEIDINNKEGVYPFFKNLVVITDP